jgi:hypothetical protein
MDECAESGLRKEELTIREGASGLYGAWPPIHIGYQPTKPIDPIGQLARAFLEEDDLLGGKEGLGRRAHRTFRVLGDSTARPSG